MLQGAPVDDSYAAITTLPGGWTQLTVDDPNNGIVVFRVRVTNGGNTLEYVIEMRQTPPLMGDVPDQTATSGSAFSLAIAPHVTLTNGDAITGYVLTGTLPTGTSFNTTTGVLDGTPTETGTFSLSVTASDDDGASNGDGFVLTVDAAPVVPSFSAISDIVESDVTYEVPTTVDFGVYCNNCTG